MNEKNLTLKMSVAALAVAAAAFAANLDAFRSGRAGSFFRNLATPRSGESEVLPSDVLPVLDYIRKSGVRSVSMSKRLADNRFFAQPITESIYPVVVKERGELLVFSSLEALPPECRILQKGKGIGIACCR